MGKVGVCECQHCHKGFKIKELAEDGKREFKNLKGTVRTPIWKYTGLALILLLVCGLVYSNKQKETKVATLIANPAMFDKYTFKTEDDHYSTFKVLEVFKDSIYVNFNTYETDKLTRIYEIDIKDNYDPDAIYSLTASEIDNLYASGAIMDIERD
tara:strand:+ start:265 stop:729 length:465 start_codon:yes stop_codon:yes gene_type:complete